MAEGVVGTVVAFAIGAIFKIIGRLAQYILEPVWGVPAAPTCADMTKLVPLSLPVTTGLELTTRILYPVPLGVPAGI